MRYESAYFGRQGECSLVLQQWEEKREKSKGEKEWHRKEWCRKERKVLVLAGICRVKEMPQAGDYFWIGLQEWFREVGKWQKTRERDRALAKRIERILQEIGDAAPGARVELAGVLGVGEQLYLFGNDGGSWYLVQEQFGRGVLRKVKIGGGAWDVMDSEEREEGVSRVCVKECRMQEGATILFGFREIFDHLEEREIAECMWQGEVTDEECMQRRLEEIGREAACRGAECPAAVMLRCRETQGNRR